MKKKTIIILFLFILIILVIFFALNWKRLFNNTITKSEEVAKFYIDKTQCYSNIGAISNQTTYQNPEWNLNIYQYTDIAIYIGRLEDYNIDNYIEKLYINNINISESERGSQELYYLNPLNFGNSDISNLSDENKINDELKYNMINYDNKENDIKYSIPIFFEDCSNPITLRYLNSDIVTNYTISTTELVEFNGSLLKNENIDLEDIKTNISFDLNIVTESGETHTINLEFEISLEDENSTIYDGEINIIDENINDNF